MSLNTRWNWKTTKISSYPDCIVRQINVGQTLIYDDGRPGHRNVKATVVALTDNGFVAQFEDRADTTSIRWDDSEWMRHIRFES